MVKELTTKQAAAATGYHQSTIQHAAQHGLIKARKKGRVWFVEVPSLMEFGKITPYKRPAKPSPEEIMELTLDLDEEQIQEAKEILDKAQDVVLIAEEAQQNVQNWKESAVFTYEDMLEQYRRGMSDGYRNGFRAGYEEGMVFYAEKN